MKKSHEWYINYCLELAAKGIAAAMPNPCVGAVVVHNGQIIGEGYTQPYGGSHAEVVAIGAVEDKELLKTATLYVTMEPCCHTGKTPPCTDLILHSEIPKVVVGARDSFEEVDGKGIELLRSNGVEVVVPILENECKFVNRRFYSFYEKRRPYVILKWAETQDGFIDKDREDGDIGVNWISCEETNKTTHTWRSQEIAIAVGKNTAKVDNPSLTTRNVKGKNPIRMVFDRNNELSKELKLFQPEAEIWVFNASQEGKEGHINWIKIPFENSVEEFLNVLFERKIMSVIIEGGRHVLQSFIQSENWDEIRRIKGSTNFKSGVKAPKFSFGNYQKYSYQSGEDSIDVVANNHIYLEPLRQIDDASKL